MIVYTVVFWISFILNRTWTFESKGNIKKQIFKYTVLFVFNLIIGNIIIMFFLTDIMGLGIFISPILKTAIIVIWNFYIYKWIIYI